MKHNAGVIIDLGSLELGLEKIALCHGWLLGEIRAHQQCLSGQFQNELHADFYILSIVPLYISQITSHVPDLYICTYSDHTAKT